MLNNNVSFLNLSSNFSYETLKIETILNSLEQKDPQLADSFKHSIREVQKYLSKNKFEFDKENKAEILTKIINTEIVSLKAMDQEPIINDYLKYDYYIKK